MEKINISRRELYDLVWSTPMTTLSKKYLISDNGLRKICKQLEIPMPKAGHWEKLRAGKEVTIEKLSDNKDGEKEISLNLRPEGDKTKVGLQTELSILKAKIEDCLGNLLNVTESLNNPDELVRQAKFEIEASKKEKYLHDGLLINRVGAKFMVAPGNVSRALLFWDTLIKAVKKRGHEVERKSNEFVFRVYTEEFKVSLREKLKRFKVESKYSWDQYQKKPTGIFIFSAIGWINESLTSEDGKLPIENQISKIIAGLEIKSKAIALERDRIHKYWENHREKERLEKERKQKVEDELIAFRNLIKQSKRWKDSQMVREFLMDKKLKAINHDEYTDELHQKLEWGMKKADWYDPNLETKDDILLDSDRERVILIEKPENKYIY